MAEKEIRNFALRDKDGNEIGVFTGKSTKTGCSEGCEPWSFRYQVARTRYQEGGCGETRINGTLQ